MKIQYINQIKVGLFWRVEGVAYEPGLLSVPLASTKLSHSHPRWCLRPFHRIPELKGNQFENHWTRVTL